eukprot:11274360-Ditylum_brightwellii.AAC.1
MQRVWDLIIELEAEPCDMGTAESSTSYQGKSESSLDTSHSNAYPRCPADKRTDPRKVRRACHQLFLAVLERYRGPN